MKIYTKFGDRGKTKLYGGDTVSKTSVRVDSYGSMDEICSTLGLIVAELREHEEVVDLVEECEEIQQHLFNCGSDLATPRELRPYKQTEDMVEFLEKKIDEYVPQLPKVETFIIPGGHKIAAMFHQVRTMTRRGERKIVALIEEGEAVNLIGLKYINRLSDYFFVVARLVNVRFGVKDVAYVRSAKVFKSGG